MSGMSASLSGALKTVFMRLVIASQYGGPAFGGCIVMYSAEWQATQLACALAEPGIELGTSSAPAGGSTIVFGAAPTAATPHASTAARTERRKGFGMAVTPERRFRLQ